MKKTILLILSCFVFFAAQAQEKLYHPEANAMNDIADFKIRMIRADFADSVLRIDTNRRDLVEPPGYTISEIPSSFTIRDPYFIISFSKSRYFKLYRY